MPASSRPLSDLNCAVTGASSGIGRAIALTLAERGADLFLHARSNGAGLEQTAEQAARLGAETHLAFADLSDLGGCQPLVETAWDWRPVDAWIHNAGADVLTGEAAGLSFDEKLERLWQTDVRGTMAVCREVGRRMKDRGSGAIVTIGWDQAEVGMAGDSGEMFSAVKGAVMAFTRSLAKSLAPQVRVNCVAPGWIQTKWGENAPEYWRNRAVKESLLGRWGKPEDVAGAAAYLASPDAAFVTGQTLNVNGGFAGAAE